MWRVTKRVPNVEFSGILRSGSSIVFSKSEGVVNLGNGSYNVDKA